MSPLEPLAPDQRAVVALVLQQGRSYDEIAGLLGMPVDAVRGRARAGLAALARDNGLPDEVTGPLADYLLGQQREGDADATRGLLADSGPARAWAADVAARLEDVAPRGLPEIPAAAPAVPGPRPRPVREPAPRDDDDAATPPASSRLGGVLLIAGVLAVVAVVLFVVLGGGDDPAGEQVAASPSPAPTATPAPTSTPQVADTIPLRSTTGGKAKGTMTVFLQDERLLFALEAQGVPQSSAGAAYAVWFTGPGDKARRLGFTNPVGADGRLGIQGPSDKDLEDFPRLYATYARVVVSQETSEDARRPSGVILGGKLPKGR
jgi:Anti-sigma-K factor rskA/Sigma-70, region 4